MLGWGDDNEDESELSCNFCDRIATYKCTTCTADICGIHQGHGEGHAKD